MLLLLSTCGGKTESGEAKSAEEKNSLKSSSIGKKAAEKETTEGKSAKKRKKKREKTTSVRVSPAVRSNLIMPIVAEGTIRARHSAEIHAEIEGRLTGIFVQEGGSVRKGQLLAKIDAREYEVEAEEARAKYLQALSSLAVEEDSLGTLEMPELLRKASLELERLEKAGKISREEKLLKEIALDVEALKNGAYRGDIVAARSGVSAARTALERARLNLERTEIRSPFSGVITGLRLSVGEQLSKGQLVCSLINNKNIEAEVGVLESDMSGLAAGSPALLVIPSLDDTLHVKVDVISPHFDQSSRTCQVLLRFRSKDGRARPGMFIKAIIAGRKFKDKLLVPKEAIITRDGRPLLFKVDDGRAKWLYVKIGLHNDYLVSIERILQGGALSPGDLVVISDHLTLSHDAKIKIKKTLPVFNPWQSRDKVE